jgi:ABC-2 type transport system permease protein/lipopolysaccharide transport system permease protein
MNKNVVPLTIFDSVENRGLGSFLIHSVRDIFAYRFVLFNLVNTNLRARYRRSTMGFLWTLVNPLFTMTILSVVFSTIYKLPFADFGVYIFSGLLPWNLMSNSIVNGSVSLIYAEGYLKKVYVPKLVFPIATVGVETANFLFSLISLSILALFLGAKVSWGLLFLPFALLIMMLFVLGIILVVSIVTVYFRDLFHILQIVFLGLFYLVPIVYKKEFFGDRLSFVLRLNPFYYFIELFHTIIYEAKIPDATLWLICIALMVVSVWIGLLVFKSMERNVIYRL